MSFSIISSLKKMDKSLNSSNTKDSEEYLSYDNYNEIEDYVKKKDESQDSNQIELRILDFLQKKGVEFRSPWDKFYDYCDEKRRNIPKNQSPTSDLSSPFNKGKVFALNSNLFNKRVATAKEKSLLQTT